MSSCLSGAFNVLCDTRRSFSERSVKMLLTDLSIIRVLGLQWLPFEIKSPKAKKTVNRAALSMVRVLFIVSLGV